MLIFLWKLNHGYLSVDRLVPNAAYKVAFNFTIDSLNSGEELFVKTFIPKNNLHQTIESVAISQQDLGFKAYTFEDSGTKAEWRGKAKNTQNLSYAFMFQGQAINYSIDEHLKVDYFLPEDTKSFLAPSEYIQSNDLRITILAESLSASNTSLKQIVQSFYNYVYQIPAIQTRELTDALSTLVNQEASCNGKSRLLVALCRSQGIPARLVGGLILRQEQKRTSHLWTEIWMGDQWVPFDALNGHFAYLPANYLELYRGDHFLITRTPDIHFDYLYNIEKEKFYPQQSLGWLTLWGLVNEGGIPISLLKVLLLLPLCGLVVGLFRNVIGIRTIGILLPAIIAVSFDEVGLIFGLFAFLIVISIVSLLHFPLERWGILHTPKLIIMMTGVVVCLLSLALLGLNSNLEVLGTVIFFPIIVLTIAAEKFAKTIIESGVLEALQLMGQTLLLTLVCYLIFKPDFITGFFLTFPETYASIIGLLLVLGRWIGLRLTEYIRFARITETKQEALN